MLLNLQYSFVVLLNYSLKVFMLVMFKVEDQDFLQAYNTLIPSTLRVSTCYARRLPHVIEPLLRNIVEHILNKIERSFHHPFLTQNNYSYFNRYDFYCEPKM